ncbi:protein FAM234A-like isoform 2-T2 [Salvelinus alpinus]|uniref:protein FAM234A-like isoform X1 n=2 Tax=Salvelinus alpinus TaxID=8036 RepID=UPI0039FD786A
MVQKIQGQDVLGLFGLWCVAEVMMEPTEHATEADPLKREAVEGGGAVPSAQTKKSLGLSKLTHWRTAVFFLSLFLCLIVYTFSFIIPCPVRPQYLTFWNCTFLQAATYDFLALEDASKDKVMDVLFVLDSKGNQNISCFDADSEMRRPEGGVDFPSENLRGISKELIFMAMFG